MALTRRHFCGMACASLALGASGCAVNPATGQRGLMLVSPADEKRIGAKKHPEVVKEFGGVYNDPKISAFVTAVGRRLAAVTETPGLGFTFTVLDSPIVNAFALPGGYVYITRGLMSLAENEAELAGVLGHELGHVVARHGAQRYSRTLLAGIGVGLLGAVTGDAVGGLARNSASRYLMGYSQDQELEADLLGVRYIKRTGYDPGAMSTLLTKMRANSRLEARIAGRSPDEIDEMDGMSTHPRSGKRLILAIQRAGAAAGTGVIERNSYLHRIDNMIYGDSPDQGYARGRVFAHTGLRVRFEAPPGFHLRNMSDKVVAADAERKTIILFGAAKKPHKGNMVSYIDDVWADGADLRDLKPVTVNGMPAATASLSFKKADESVVLRLAAVRVDAQHIYRFLGATPGESAARLDRAFAATFKSFRRISRTEAAAIKPWRITIVPVRPGETAYRLGRRTPFSDYRTERFQVLNGLSDKRALAAGLRVKLVSE